VSKKLTPVLLAASLMLLPVLSGQVSAQESPTITAPVYGKNERGHILIPLRVVSEGLGAKVKWDKPTLSAKITREKIEVNVPLNSDYATVNGKSVRLDARTIIERGVTYVPLRFVAQSLGGTVTWNNETQKATASLGDRKVVINARQYPELTQTRLNALVQAANDSANPSKYKQIRTKFKPYFTDEFINKIVQRKNVLTQHRFVSKPYIYYYEGTGRGSITQLESPRDAGGMNVERIITIRYINGKWMAENVDYLLVSP